MAHNANHLKHNAERRKEYYAPLRSKKGRRQNTPDISREQWSTERKKKTAALDTLLRQVQERGSAPATMVWIPKTVRPRVTTIMIELPSERTQAAELANESEWDVTRMRISILLYEHQRATQQTQEASAGIKESSQMKMQKEIRRRLRLAEKGEWHKLLSSHLEDHPRKTSKTRKEEDTGEGSQRTRDLQNATCRAQQGNIRGACQALVGRGLAPNNHETVAKVKNMVALDVTTDEYKELEDTRKEASKLKKQGTRDDNRSGSNSRSQSWSCTRSQRTQKQPHHSNRSSTLRLRALTAWTAAWTKGKQGHQEMKARSAAMIVPLDRDGIRVRPIALTEALVKLAQGTLMERIHWMLRKNAEPSKMKNEGKAQHIGQFSVRTPMGAEVLAPRHWFSSTSRTRSGVSTDTSLYGRSTHSYLK